MDAVATQYLFVGLAIGVVGGAIVSYPLVAAFRYLVSTVVSAAGQNLRKERR